MPKNRPGGQASSDTIKGGFLSDGESCSLTRRKRLVLGQGCGSWSVLSQRCQSSSDLWVGRLLPWGRQVMIMSHITRNTCKAASIAFRCSPD